MKAIVVTLLLITVESCKSQFCPEPSGLVGACVVRPGSSCVSDSQCSNGQLCCKEGCGSECKDPINVSPGRCPRLPPSAYWVRCFPVNRCENDVDCSPSRKCCRQPCGKRCVDTTIDPVQKLGTCPTPPDPSVILCGPDRSNQCGVDGDCRGDLKCCPNPCGRVCDLVRPKPGMCPSFRPPPFCRRRSNQCDNDRDCPLTQKCCQLGCSNRCIDVAIDPVQKPGICPTPPDPAVVRCRTPIVDKCSNDGDCNGGLKCCPNPCGRICDLVQPKPGMCPSFRPPPFCRRRSNQCDNDGDCPLTQKCCQLGCSNRCIDVAIDPIQKPGTCPAPPDPALVSCVLPIINQCRNDGNCRRDLKCCPNPCGRRCDLDRPKPGFCSRIKTPTEICLVIDNCKTDRDCPLSQKCCQQACGTRCENALVFAPPSKPGVCPVPVGPPVESCPSPPLTNQCNIDDDCRGNQKCCSSLCGRVCDLVKPKPGFCPNLPRSAFFVKCVPFSRCENDGDCPSRQKCCERGCGRRCVDANTNSPIRKPGVCPTPPDLSVTSCVVPITNECTNDGDCRDELKCCPNPCGRTCDLVRPKPGVCPRFVPARRPCRKFDECENDRDCPITQKCCRQGCGYRCQSVSKPVCPRLPCDGLIKCQYGQELDRYNCPTCRCRQCPKGVRVVNCLEDPCMTATCPSHPNARCVSNFCGGCNADFFKNGNLVTC